MERTEISKTAQEAIDHCKILNSRLSTNEAYNMQLINLVKEVEELITKVSTGIR